MNNKHILSVLLLAAALLCNTVPVTAYAETNDSSLFFVSEKQTTDPDSEKTGAVSKAKDITKSVKIKANIKCDIKKITDGDNTTRSSVAKDTVLKCTSKQAVGGLYFETEKPAGNITVSAGERIIESDEREFLHFFVGGIDAKVFTVTFQNAVSITNIRFLSKGSLPGWVQIWESAPSQCDVMILPAHYDDDTLFFGGVAPWAIDQGAVVMVAFLCKHGAEPHRKHEMLDGVWASGIHTYPVFGSYSGTKKADVKTALNDYKKAGITWEDMLKRQVEIYRKYKPQIILTHSMTGEYGHSMHIIYERLAVEAAMLAGDESVFPELTEKYGVHDISKIYIHNYSSSIGRIVLDLDRKLSSFKGKTPYQVTIDAFKKHKSQVNSNMWNWLYEPKRAADIKSFSPCKWGLYHSNVGNDTKKNTLFDNIVLIRDQDKGY